MKKALFILSQLLSLLIAMMVAAVLGLWLAVISGTDSPMKQSFADTARLARTVTAVTLELLHRDEAPVDYSLRSQDIAQATLVLMKDSGVSGIFSTGDIRSFSKPHDVERLANEFNRFLGNLSLEKNKLLKSGTSFYLILMDRSGKRSSYEYIGEELFMNDGTYSRLLRPRTSNEDPPLGMADILGL